LEISHTERKLSERDIVKCGMRDKKDAGRWKKMDIIQHFLSKRDTGEGKARGSDRMLKDCFDKYRPIYWDISSSSAIKPFSKTRRNKVRARDDADSREVTS